MRIISQTGISFDFDSHYLLVEDNTLIAIDAGKKRFRIGTFETHQDAIAVFDDIHNKYLQNSGFYVYDLSEK